MHETSAEGQMLFWMFRRLLWWLLHQRRGPSDELQKGWLWRRGLQASVGWLQGLQMAQGQRRQGPLPRQLQQLPDGSLVSRE